MDPVVFMQPEDSVAAEERDPFEILDDSTAQWAMRRIAQARADTQMWREHFSAQLEKITRANEADEAFFTAALSRYFETVPKKETRTQSKYVLPCGELVRKKQQPEFVRDDAVLAPFLMENGMESFVKMKPSTDWAELKKQCVLTESGAVVDSATGLVLEGVTAQQRPDKFEVKINA